MRGIAARKAVIANIVGITASASTAAHWAPPTGGRRLPVAAATTVQVRAVPRIERKPAAIPGTPAMTRAPTRMYAVKITGLAIASRSAGPPAKRTPPTSSTTPAKLPASASTWIRGTRCRRNSQPAITTIAG